MVKRATNIVYLLDSLKIGGVQHGVLLQLERLNRSKYNPQVWVLRDKKSDWALADEFKRIDVPVVSIPVKHFNSRSNILTLAQKFKKEQIGFLNTNSFYPNIIGRIASHLVNVPVTVVNYHNTYEHSWSKKSIILERMLKETTDAFICVSKAVQTFLQPLIGLPEDKLKVLYNGIDINYYNLDADKNYLRKQLGLPADVPIVGMVGRLTKVKEVPILLKAIPKIAEEFPNAQFIIVGDGQERENLEKQVKDEHLDTMVRFLGSRSDVPQILNAIDCIALPSLAEGFPRIILEAFASKTPVIATPAGGVPEVLKDEANGLLIPFSSPGRLAEAINKTLRNPEETKNRSERAFRDVQKFSLENWMRETEEIFDEVIEKKDEMLTHYFDDTAIPSNFSLSLKYYEFRSAYLLNKMLYRAETNNEYSKV